MVSPSHSPSPQKVPRILPSPRTRSSPLSRRVLFPKQSSPMASSSLASVVRRQAHEDARQRITQLFPNLKGRALRQLPKEIDECCAGGNVGKRRCTELCLGARHPNTLGVFQIIPSELRHTVLNYLSMSSLSKLALTSHAQLGLVTEHMNEASTIRAVQTYLDVGAATEGGQVEAVLGRYHELGQLMKRLTLLSPTRVRVELMLAVYKKMGPACLLVSQEATDAWGRVLHSVTRGWEYRECKMVYDSMIQISGSDRSLALFLCSAIGSDRLVEHQLRAFFGRLVLGDALLKRSAEDYQFWLAAILTRQPFVYQAKILYLLFGPVVKDHVVWDRSVTVVPNEAADVQLLSEFGKALNQMLVCERYWKLDEVVAIFEELISIPSGWLIDNVACVLLKTRPVLAVKLLASRAANGRFQEMADIFNGLLLMSARCDQPMTFALDVLRCLGQLLSGADLTMLFRLIAATHSQNVMDLFLHEEGLSMVEDMRDEVTSHENFILALLVKMFVS